MASLAQPSDVSSGPHLDNRRVAAALIDLVVPAAIAAVAYAVGLSLTRGVVLVALGWTLYYFFALESGDGQTLGKRVMKLRVVSADGSPASMTQIAKRTVVRILDGHIVGLIVMLATGERRQRLGDIVAGTIVTDADSTARSDTPITDLAESPQAAPTDVTPARPKRSLSMPSIPWPALSMPSLRRRPAGKDPVRTAPGAGVPWYKRSLSMPSLRRHAKQDVDALELTPTAAPSSVRRAPVPGPREPKPVPRLEALDPMPPEPPGPEPIEDFMAREVVIEREPIDEVDGPYEPEAYEPELAMSFEDREPSVELDRPDPDDYDTAVVVEYEADVERTVAREAGSDSDEAEGHHEEGSVKPIETVSSIDLVMQDAEERRPGDRRR